MRCSFGLGLAPLDGLSGRLGLPLMLFRAGLWPPWCSFGFGLAPLMRFRVGFVTFGTLSVRLWPPEVLFRVGVASLNAPSGQLWLPLQRFKARVWLLECIVKSGWWT